MKRLLAVAFGVVLLTACEDSTQPLGQEAEVGQPNIAITSPEDSYGFVDEFFSFLKPLVDDPQVSGASLNTNLMPEIELWQRSDLDLETLDPSGFHTCTGRSGAEPLHVFTPEVNADGTAYHHGWKTSAEPVGGLQDSTDYRLCVKITLAGPTGAVRRLVGWRDVRPEKSTNPNNPAGAPYLFENGRTIPIEFWLSSRSLCSEPGVIDCTVATFDASGGMAKCDNPQCGVDVPSGTLPGLVTFEIRYVECTSYNQAPNGDTVSVEYLGIDIPQYYGCLNVRSYGQGWTGISSGNTGGIVYAACRDTDIPTISDERVLLHIEDLVDGDSDGRLDVYALPTRPFELACDQSQTLAADASLGEKLQFYARQGLRTLLPFVDPPALTAAHAGFGGGSSEECGDAVSGFDGGDMAPSCSSMHLTSGPTTTSHETVTVYEYRAVWALPSMITERLLVDATGAPVGSWEDPVSASPGGAVYPAVRVVNEVECVGSSTGECASTQENVAGATVTFWDESSNTLIGKDDTDANGIAFVPWTLPSSGGLYTASGSGFGVGVHPDLQSVTLAPPNAEGTYQDHVGNIALPLRAPRVKFDVSVCSDKSSVLDTRYVDAEYGAGIPIAINISGSDSDIAYLYVTNDCDNVYFALEVPASEDLQNELRVAFVDQLESRFTDVFEPTNPDTFPAVPEIGDDMWFIARDSDKKSPTYNQWLIDDWHVSDDCTGSSKQAECGVSDPVQNLLAHDDGAVYAPLDDPTATVYEFARCLPGPENPSCVVDPDGYDFYVPAVGGSTWIGFYLVLQGGKGAQGNTEYPDFRVFQPIEIVRQ
jgi:hypothetical protein